MGPHLIYLLLIGLGLGLGHPEHVLLESGFAEGAPCGELLQDSEKRYPQHPTALNMSALNTWDTELNK